MGLFDFLKRRKSGAANTISKRDSMSRIEYLMDLGHSRMEEPVDSWGGLDFPQLVEQQLSDGKIDLAFRNLGSQVAEYFRLANLYWGQGDLETALSYLEKTLERHEKISVLSIELNLDQWSYREGEHGKAAAYLLNNRVVDSKASNNNIGYQPWFVETLLDYCLNSAEFDEASWQAAEDEWTKNRFPKYKLAEFSVYIKALTGQYESGEELLAAHETMFKGRAKRKNTDSDLLEGYYDNELIIDYIFACILKRIGWEGRYRHSWPNTDRYDSIPETQREPDSYLKIIAAPVPKSDPDTGIISDTQEARRYIDHRLKVQRLEGEELFSAERPVKSRGKVSGALRDLGWVKDPATLDLMRTYRVDNVLNESTHIALCDPVDGYMRLKSWGESLSDEFDLHSDFIALAGSEEKSDYMDPQGYWYVYWKKDKKIYAVERDDWHDPVRATKDARLGLTLWPSYTSFVAWWVSEHIQSEFS